MGKLFYHVQDNQTIYFDINGDFVEGEQIIDSSFNSCEVGEKEEQYFDVKEAKKYKNSYVCLNGTIHL